MFQNSTWSMLSLNFRHAKNFFQSIFNFASPGADSQIRHVLRSTIDGVARVGLYFEQCAIDRKLKDDSYMENVIFNLKVPTSTNLIIRLYERHLSVVEAKTNLAFFDIFGENVQISWFLRFRLIRISGVNSQADWLTKGFYLDSISLDSAAEI